MAGDNDFIINTLGNEPPRPRIRIVPVQQEPKRINRFCLEFPEIYGIESYLVQSISPLTGRIDKNGNFIWDDIIIEFINIIGPSTERAIYNMINSFSKKKNILHFFKNQKKERLILNLLILDPVGVTVESWLITVDKIVKAKFGEFDYSKDNLSKCSLTLKLSNCTLEI